MVLLRIINKIGFGQVICLVNYGNFQANYEISNVSDFPHQSHLKTNIKV